ncbi:P-loop containing nucleoside triphosphate hydrolase protein [Trichoderma sp. SZMC 28011]
MLSSSHIRASSRSSSSSEEDAPGDSCSHSHSSDSEGEDATQQLPAPAKVTDPSLRWHSGCALIINDGFLGGQELGLPTDIRSRLMVHYVLSHPAWLAFTIEFPRASEGEEEGFGTVYSIIPRRYQKPVLSSYHKIQVKFPLGKLAHAVKPIEPALVKSLPEGGSKFSVFEIDVKDGPDPVVIDFGLPFDNPGHPSDGWINNSQPITGNHTLLDALSQQTFRFVGSSFLPKWRFKDDNDHLTAMTQSQVQDFVWLHAAADEIYKIKLRASFVSTSGSPSSYIDDFYVLVQLKEFPSRYDAALRCLLNSDTLCLHIYDPAIRAPVDRGGPAKWPARVVHGSTIMNALVHQGIADENAVFNWSVERHLILAVRRPKEIGCRPNFNIMVVGDEGRKDYLVSFNFLADSKPCQRKVEAVLQFHPDANPTLRGQGGLQLFGARSTESPTSSNIKLKMRLHRDLLRGYGFFEVLRENAKTQPPMQLAQSRSLPAVNLLPASQHIVDALMEDVLPRDRKRFCTYLSRAPLGFGLITGDPGFGKTTVLSVATLGMSIALGPIYACAATDVAADNFAEHLNRISEKFTSRLNEAKALGESPARRILIVRGYDIDDEVAAFHKLLENPRIGDKAAPPYNFALKPKWRLHLSLAFWLLVALRSPAVRPFHCDDPVGIQSLQSYLHNQSNLKRLRNVATGVIGYQEYKSGHTVGADRIRFMFRHILRCTNILCTNISLSCQTPYDRWKSLAKGIAVDEANNVGRPDLYSVWGNTLLPCLLCGDDKQLEPRVVSFGQKDEKGHSVNRLEDDGKLSALLFFKGNRWPVFRLRTQLRMATGLFDLCQEVVKDMPDFGYGHDCDISLDRHACGRELEAFLQKRFPELAPPLDGMLSEAFINCTRSKFYFSPVTGSGWNPAQSRRALHFVHDLVTQTKITPADVFIITPYEANVDFIEGERQKLYYSAISSMAPAATVDDFQGRQGNIIILVTAATETSEISEPGYISDIHYLCVMLSRHISGLVIFGDHSIPQACDISNIRKDVAETDKNPMKSMLSILMRKKRVATLTAA